MGYLGGSTISTDGEFGNITHYKVADFQIKRGIPVDGVVGPRTWQYLANKCGYVSY